MRTGAIFARGSCRALKWMALVGVVFALGAGSAAAQITEATDDIMVTLPTDGALMEGQVATVTVAVPVRISADLSAGADRTFTLGVAIADAASDDVGTGYGDVTQRETTDIEFSPSSVAELTFTLPARDFSGEGNAGNHTATASISLVAAHDLDAEDEAFQLAWDDSFGGVPSGVTSQRQSDGTYQSLDVFDAAADDMTVDDDESVNFTLTQGGDGNATEGMNIGLTLKAGTEGGNAPAGSNPFDDITGVMVTLNHTGAVAGEYTLPTAATTGIRFGGADNDVRESAVTLSAKDKNDGNRNVDTITVTANAGTASNPMELASAEVTIDDIHALPAADKLSVTAYDAMTGGEKVMSVAAGGMVYLEVAADRGTAGYPMDEALTVTLSLSDDSLATLGATQAEVPSGADSQMAPRVMLTANTSNRITPGELMVSFSASGKNDAANGPSTPVVGTPLPLTITQPGEKLITAKSQADVDKAVADAMAAGAGDHGFNPDESFDLDPSALFELTDAATTAGGYTIQLSGAASDNAAVVAGMIDGMARIEADAVGNANVTITARAMMASSSATLVEQTLLNEAQIMVAVSVVAALQVPGMPTSLKAVGGDGQVELSWEAPATGGTAASYEYTYGVGTAREPWSAATSPATVTDLENGTEYTFEVRAKNAAGDGEAATATATPGLDPVVPGAPTDVTAEALEGAVGLSWTAPDDGGAAIEKYQYQSVVDERLSRWTDTGEGAATTVTLSADPGTAISYYVRAVNSVGTGASSKESNEVTPLPVDPGVQVIVDKVEAATSVAESGGLTVTVTAKVPAGTKVDGKVAPIPARDVVVSFVFDDASIKAGEDAEPEDMTVLGNLLWEKITRTEKESTQKYTFRVAIGQDLDAEDEKFQVAVEIDGGVEKVSKVITIDDAETQEYVLSVDSTEKAKNTIKEGGSGTLKLEAMPARTMEIPTTLALDPNDPSKYTLGETSGTFGTGSFTTTVSAKTDGNREDDTVTVKAYTSGTLGHDVEIASLDITVTDANALPAVKATLADKDGKALSPQPESVKEGGEVMVMLTVVDKDGKAMKAAEKLSVSLMPTGTADGQDYRLATHPIEIASGKESSAAVKLMVTEDQDVGAETLMFDAVVSGDAKIGTEKRSVAGVLSLMIEDATQKLVWANSQDEVEAAVYAAKNAGAGDDMTFTVGETIEVMGSALFSSAEGVTLSYTAESSMNGVASTSVSGGSVMVTAAAEGMADITITAHANMASGVKILDQTDPGMASIKFPVEVGLEALSITLSGPEDMNVVEGGMGAMVTATANRPVTEDVTVMLVRDRAMSSAGDADYTVEAITIAAGATSGTTMVMAVEDDIMENEGNMPEELVLYGMTEGMAGEVTGEVKLYLWDAAVPALPVIAQLLLAAFLAAGGYRRYRRR